MPRGKKHPPLPSRSPLFRLFDDQAQACRCVLLVESIRGLKPEAVERALQALDALQGAAPALEQERPVLEALARCARELRALKSNHGGRR